MPAARAVWIEELLQAYAEPTRLALLVLLSGGEACVCHLVEALGLPQPTVSRHLAVLRRCGLVATRREGRWVWYRLESGSGLQRKLCACLTSCRDELPGLAEAARRCARLRAGRGCC